MVERDVLGGRHARLNLAFDLLGRTARVQYFPRHGGLIDVGPVVERMGCAGMEEQAGVVYSQ